MKTLKFAAAALALDRTHRHGANLHLEIRRRSQRSGFLHQASGHLQRTRPPRQGGCHHRLGRQDITKSTVNATIDITGVDTGRLRATTISRAIASSM
jgi:hypothetical protein